LFIYTKREKMADKGSNNWLWWSIGGIATLGLGLGIYYYIKAQKEDKAKQLAEKLPTDVKNSNNPIFTPPVVNNQQTNPFSSIDALKAFQQWVFDIKKEAVGNSNGTPDGLWGGKTATAYTKYGVEYTQTLQTAIQVEEASKSTSLQDVKNALGGSIPVTDYGTSTKRFQVRLWDGSGNYNVLANFNDVGDFWIDGMQNGEKFSGKWYKKNNQFYITIDGKTSNDSNLGGMIYAIAQEKLPVYFTKFTGFNGGDGRNALVFGVNGGEGGISQDMML
jgi:hypothetical protein